jgi:hypothetical protein
MSFYREHEPNESNVHPIDDNPKHELILTTAELLFIDDHLTMLVNESDYAGCASIKPQMPAPVVAVELPLILVIGAALLETFSNPGVDVPVSLSDSHLLHLREIAHTDAVLGSNRVGLNLKQKIYGALLSEVTMASKVEDLLGEIEIDLGDEDEPQSKLES